ncbi:hypothetical protein QQF64_017516 [Cirrhinus molitorella]|uniref:Uncharacterized protein n=1 Tax=Cirrhinus molitorella TaxID=172907 RepID=A0ABR3LIX0_9TELE
MWTSGSLPECTQSALLGDRLPWGWWRMTPGRVGGGVRLYDWPPLFWLEPTQSATRLQCGHSSNLHTCDATPSLKGAPSAPVATQLVAQTQASLLVTTTMNTVARRPEVLDVEGLRCCQEMVVLTLRESWGSLGVGVASGTRAGVAKRCNWPARVVCWRGVTGTKDFMRQWASH